MPNSRLPPERCRRRHDDIAIARDSAVVMISVLRKLYFFHEYATGQLH